MIGALGFLVLAAVLLNSLRTSRLRHHTSPYILTPPGEINLMLNCDVKPALKTQDQWDYRLYEAMPLSEEKVPL